MVINTTQKVSTKAGIIKYLHTGWNSPTQPGRGGQTWEPIILILEVKSALLMVNPSSTRCKKEERWLNSWISWLTPAGRHSGFRRMWLTGLGHDRTTSETRTPFTITAVRNVCVLVFRRDETAAANVRRQQLTARGDYSSTVLVDPPAASGCMYLGHSILQSHLFKTRSWLSSSRTPPCTTGHTKKMGWNQPILRHPGVFPQFWEEAPSLRVTLDTY